MKPKQLFFAFALLWAGMMSAQTATDTVYVFLDDQADAGYFLPAPPDTASMDYVDDLLQWQWGKTQRNTPRGTQASDESLWMPEASCRIYAGIFGLDTISPEATPAIYHLLFKAHNTGDQSTKKAKEKYMRTRPFVQMGEGTWGKYDDDFLRTNGSYPSGHTSFGWTTALVLAEMWPELQDTILRRGFQFGENRIITGAHYQSDVTAGYLCGAAAFAHAHTNAEYQKDIAAARAEYIALKGLPADYDPVAQAAALPDGTKILNAHVDTASYRYLGDIMRYWSACEWRNDAERRQQAIDDANKELDYYYTIFGEAMNISITEETTPALTVLLSTLKTQAKAAYDAVKYSTFRKRPYVQLGGSTLIADTEEYYSTRSSSVSGHACMGWIMALALTEVAPDQQDELLRVGYEYGYSRVIAGYHWATDIDAARLLACAVLARLNANPDFQTLIDNARKEVQGEMTDLENISTDSRDGLPPVSTGVYSIDGKYISKSEIPSEQGVYIVNGKKEIR